LGERLPDLPESLKSSDTDIRIAGNTSLAHLAGGRDANDKNSGGRVSFSNAHLASGLQTRDDDDGGPIGDN
jgi:hypothetical protein